MDAANDTIVIFFIFFNQDELNVTVPKHIPSRFVAPIPFEFDLSQGATKKTKKNPTFPSYKVG